MKKIDDILQHLGIEELNAMQEEAIMAVQHSSADVLILSPTGTGKTLAYLLPTVQLVQHIVEGKDWMKPETEAAPFAVVIVPGRELALQSSETLKNMGGGIRGMALYGGRPAMDEHRSLRQIQPHIVFGTPGRLNDHFEKGNIITENVRFLIIDEFDKCLEMGFQNEMLRLLNSLPNVERRFLLSATESGIIPRFVRMGQTKLLDYRMAEEQVPSRVRTFLVNSPTADKLETLRQLLLERGSESSVVFLNYRESVERVADYLAREGFAISTFHGGLEQKQREKALYKFSNGSTNIMVCTDLASRGLDIPEIDNIIHYHLPETEQNYIHRTGRTARWDKYGKSFFILKSGEQIPDYVNTEMEIYHFETKTRPSSETRCPAQPYMATIYIGKGRRDKVSRGDIVGFLCKTGGLQGSEIGKVSVEDRYTYAAVSRTRLHELLHKVKGQKVKGMKTVVEEVY